MTDHIKVEIVVNDKVDSKYLREKINNLLRENCSQCECHSIRVWIEKKSDMKWHVIYAEKKFNQYW